MKKIIGVIIILLAFSSAVFSQSEDSWTLKLNGRILYKGNPSEEKTISVKSRRFRKNDKIVFTYRMAQPNNTYNRTIFINDAENTLIKEVHMKNQSGSISVNASTINAFLKKKETLNIYTTSLPKSAAEAALVRISRVKLCTIEVK